MHNIDIIIVTWNSSSLIGRVLTAIEQQTVAPHKVVIVDNNSDDVTILRSVVEQYPICELVALTENIGFAAANNLGMRLCGEVEFVALLNPDAFPKPNWLAALLNAALSHPEAAAFASRLLNNSNPEILDGAGDSLSIIGKPRRRGHGIKARNQFMKGSAVFSPCAAAALYRLSAVRAIGGFDERFFCYVEDVDLAFRLLLSGYKSRYVPEAVALHIGSATTSRRSDFSIYYGQRNLIFNYVKNMPPVLFWCFLVPHIVLNISYLFGAFLIGRGRVVWQAKSDAIHNILEVWQQRRYVQLTRRASSFDVLRALKII